MIVCLPCVHVKLFNSSFVLLGMNIKDGVLVLV